MAGCICDLSQDDRVVIQTPVTQVVTTEEGVICVMVQQEFQPVVFEPEAVTQVEISGEVEEVVVQQKEITIIADCKQGPPGTPGADSFVQITGPDLGPSVGGVVDRVVVGDTLAVKWIVSLRETVTPRVKVIEVLGTYDGVDARWVAYSKIGKKVAITLTVEYNAPYLELVVVNNEATVTFETRAVRIATEI